LEVVIKSTEGSAAINESKVAAAGSASNSATVITLRPFHLPSSRGKLALIAESFTTAFAVAGALRLEETPVGTSPPRKRAVSSAVPKNASSPIEVALLVMVILLIPLL